MRWGKKKEGREKYTRWGKRKKNWEKNKYKNIQEKEDLIFFSLSLSVREGVGTRCFLHSDVHAA